MSELKLGPPQGKRTTNLDSADDLDLSQPAVHIDFHAGDVRRILRSQKCDGTCYFLRLSKPFHWDSRNDSLGEFIDGFLWQPGPAKDRRNNRPRRNRIYADAAAHEL